MRSFLYFLFILCALLQSACSHIPGLRSDTVAEIKQLAVGSDAQAQLLLAHLLEEGAGLPQDLNAALGWYRKSADQENPDACVELAKLQLSGKVAAQDGYNAVGLLFKAGKAGNTEAQALLGALFLVGKGKQEFVSQVKLARNGTEKGDNHAQYTLGWILREGAGAPRSPSDAQFWLTKAAKQGNAAAALLLGDMALNGEAGQKETAAAIRWLENAAAGGEHAAVARLSLLQGKEKHDSRQLLAPRKRRDFEDGYRRLQLEFAENQAVTDPDSALVAIRRLLALDPEDKEALNRAERLKGAGGKQLAPLFVKAEQQITATEFRSFTQSLARIIALNPPEMRLRELNAHYWLHFERVTAAMEKKREELKEERADSGDSVFKKGISLMEKGRFDAAAKLFEKLAKTPGYSNVAGAYIYLGISSLARINMSKVNEAKKLRLKGIASFQNALRFDRKATLPDGYVKYRDIFEEASRSLQ